MEAVGWPRETAKKEQRVQLVVEQVDTAVEAIRLMTVRDVADRLQCSTRTVYRLIDIGRVPPPVRLGALVRWSCQTIDAWIAAGCPKCLSSR